MRELIRNTNRAIYQFVREKDNRRVTVTLLVVLLFMIVQAVLRTAVYERSDFNLFLDPAIDAKFFGDDPFFNWLNSYNAFFYVVMSLLTPFARWFSIVLWTLLSIMSYIYSIAIIKALLPKPIKAPKMEFLIAPLLLLVLVFDNIQLGQTNMVMMFAMLVALFYLEKRRAVRSGLALGFAIAYKVTPLIFTGYFILKKRFAAAIYSLLFSLVMIILVPMLFYTPERSIEFFTSWSEMVLSPFFNGEDLKTLNVGYYHTNQSLEAFLNRHFTSYGAERYGGWHHWLDPAFMSTAQVKTLGNVLKLLLVVLLSAVTFLNKKKSKEGLVAEASLFMMAILILSPSSWVNHYILLTPAYVYLVNEIFRLPKGNQDRKLLVFALSISTTLIALGSLVIMQSFSVLFIALVLLFTVLLYYHYRHNFSRRPGNSHLKQQIEDEERLSANPGI